MKTKNEVDLTANETATSCDENSVSDAAINNEVSKTATSDALSAAEETQKNEDEQPKNSESSIKENEKLDENKKDFLTIAKNVLSYIFIDGLSGMAIGLFATLIIGTIICQIGKYIPGNIGMFINSIGTVAKLLMGAGIGIGMAYKLKKAPMVSISAGVAGLVGAFSSNIIKSVNNGAVISSFAGVGEPLGAFIAAFVAIEVGSLVSGKTKVDIIVTPLVAIFSGSIIGLLFGPPITAFMSAVGSLINTATQQQPVLMGILVSVLMGIALTLPISSAAIGISLSLSGISAGAAVVGCCCQMVGFAVMSFRENKWGGLIAQGLGTSMLQMPNLVKHPLCWLPPVIASAILGPIGSAAFKMTSNAVGSGMGTAGLVGVLCSFDVMSSSTFSIPMTLLILALMCFILPALICFAISELMRKLGWIKPGDLKLNL